MINIRSANPEDAPAIAAMLDEFRAYLRALGDMHAIVSFGREEFLRDGFGANKAFDTLIAEKGTEVVGYAIYAQEYSTDTGRRNLFMHDLFVRGTARGLGVGEALLSRIVDICRAQGGEAVSWGVWHRNESAIRFYEKMGAGRAEGVHFMSVGV